MNPPASQPGLPTWLFVVTDLALIAAAAVIAFLSPSPLSNQAMLLIVGCIGLGALVGLVPLIARYERLKNEVLDNRQRALESLSQTVHETAQQISIATGSLHEIADLAQRNLRQAEHLPHKLQEKIAEFQAQLADANDAEKAELEEELTALRTSESERLDSISTRIAKSAAEWAKLEAAAAQHLTTLQDTLGKFPAKATAELTKMQEAAEKTVGTARESALQSLQKAEVGALRNLAEAHGTSLATLQAQVTELEKRLLAAASAASDRAAADFRTNTAAILQSLDSKIAQLAALAANFQTHAESMAQATPAAPPTAPASALTTAAAALSDAPAPPTGAEPPPAGAAAHSTAVASPPAPKRQRRTRKEDGVPTNPPIPAPAESATPASPEETSANPGSDEPTPAAEPPTDVPPPATPASAPPADDLTVPPIAMSAKSAPPPAPVAPEPAAEPAGAPPPAPADPAPAPAPARKRAPRKVEPEPEAGLDLGFEDTVPAAGSGHVEKTLSSDGATRLIATAYIGIGNRLFIRGDGAGLSWERGVPLQFVSIGKWRWETNDATAPVRFKLYKNDEHECVALGEKTLDPGHLHELVASF